MINLYHYTLRYRGLFGGGDPHPEGVALGSFVAFDSVRGDVLIIRAAIWYMV